MSLTRRIATAAALVGTLAALEGCALTVDTAWWAGSKQGGYPTPRGALAADRADHYYEVAIDEVAGLTCHAVARPWMRSFSSTPDVLYPNGFKAPMQFFTGVEGIVLVGSTALREGLCAKSDQTCQPRSSFYPYFLPFALDFAYGLYRSLTIHDPIYRSMSVDEFDGPGDDLIAVKTSCPPGTRVTLGAAGHAQGAVSLTIGEDGKIDPLEVSGFATWLEGTGALAIEVGLSGGEGFEVHWNGTARGALVGKQRALAEEQRRRTSVVVPAVPGPGAVDREGMTGETGPGEPGQIEVHARALITYGRGGIVVSGVPIDFPLEDVCSDDGMCRRGQRCRDRGDGVPLCMGPGAGHPFCSSNRDCAAGLACRPREADGVGQCQGAR